MTYSIVIKDDQIFAGTAKRDLSQFDEDWALSTKSAYMTPGLCPPGLIYVSSSGTHVIFERPPRYQQVLFVPKKRDSAYGYEPFVFNLPLPWQVYSCLFSTAGDLTSTVMAFSTSQIESIDPFTGIVVNASGDNRLYAPSLPNIYSNLYFCLAQEIPYNTDTSLESKMLVGFVSVWDSPYNLDLTQCIDSMANAKGLNHKGFLDYWASKSIGSVLSDMTDTFYEVSAYMSNPFLDHVGKAQTNHLNTLVGLAKALI